MENTGLNTPGEKLILIVDDDDSVMELFDFIARKEGFKTVKATSGEAAIKTARLLRPALILLDLMLPKPGGFEVMRELQGDDTSDIPIVIVTGRYMDRSTLELIKQEPNVKDFLEKPVEPQALAALLHTLLKTRAASTMQLPGT
ncbi:MAG: response regulator [Elusimicrobiales bacterium]|nr:response regulator [Elusimicrobiales bacterium]